MTFKEKTIKSTFIVFFFMLVQMVLELRPNLFARTVNLVLLDGQDKVNCSRIRKSKLLSVLGVFVSCCREAARSERKLRKQA